MNATWMILLAWISPSSADPIREPPPVYQVPVRKELLPFSVYPLPQLKAELTRGKLKLKYHLPPALVGEYSAEVQVEGAYRARAPFALEGKDSVAECLDTQEVLECRVSYARLVLDPSTVESAIHQQFKNPVERRARLEVALGFSGDPVGIIRVFHPRHERRLHPSR